MKSRCIRFGEWAQANWLALIAMLAVVLFILLVVIVLSWLYGFWSNGLYGTHFEINSCWQGVSAVGAGIVTIVGLAKAAWTKYGLDSKYNSPEGQKPNMTHSLIKIGEDNNERRN